MSEQKYTQNNIMQVLKNVAFDEIKMSIMD